MCGRYVSSMPPADLAAYLHVDEVKADDLPQSWNVAPTDPVYAAAESKDGVRQLGTFKWGLVPSWSKDPKGGARMINARSETLLDKPAFRKAFEARRCLIPADGFYEWLRRDDRPKQPVFVRRRDGAPMVFAGLWEVWRDPEEPESPWLRTCTVITTEANALVAPVHDRMPVILQPDAFDAWTDRDNKDAAALHRLLAPIDPDVLELWPVSDRVNSVRNNGPELIEPGTVDDGLLPL